MTQKTEELEDLRVRRTRKLLQEALLALTVEKGFAAVSVRDISERAMVNRSTFYRHYLDKYDLLDQYMDEVHGMVDTHPDHMPNGAPVGLVNMLRHIQKFADFYRVMLGANGDARFIQRFRLIVEKRFRVLLAAQEIDPNSAPLDLRLAFISSADLGAILWWLENDPGLSPEAFAMLLSPLVMASAGVPLRPAPAP